MASPGALAALHEALRAEQERRTRARGQELTGDRESFYRKLDEMAERLRAAPGYTEPDAAQRARMLEDLDNYFAERARKT